MRITHKSFLIKHELRGGDAAKKPCPLFHLTGSGKSGIIILSLLTLLQNRKKEKHETRKRGCNQASSFFVEKMPKKCYNKIKMFHVKHIEGGKYMQLKKIKMNEIKPYEKNPRKNKEAIKAVMESIKQCDYNSPIVLDENYVILAGHTRYRALEKLGYEEAECIVKSGLSEDQKKKYRLLDNKTGELALWDLDKLGEEIEGLDFGNLEIDWGLPEEKEEDEEEEPEVEFSEVLGEENNYIVLQFKTEVDWINAQSVFGLETVKCYSTRKDGKITEKMQRKGTARVLDGVKAIEKIIGE